MSLVEGFREAIDYVSGVFWSFVCPLILLPLALGIPAGIILSYCTRFPASMGKVLRVALFSASAALAIYVALARPETPPHPIDEFLLNFLNIHAGGKTPWWDYLRLFKLLFLFAGVISFSWMQLHVFGFKRTQEKSNDRKVR